MFSNHAMVSRFWTWFFRSKFGALMRKLIPLVFLVTGLTLGVGAAVLLDPEAAKAPSDQEPTASEKEKTATKSKSEKKMDEGQDYEYLKMTKQFVVPLVTKSEISGLATLSLSLGLRAGTSDRYYIKEPKLRDSFLRVLFDHANMGGFDGAFTKPGNLDPLRSALLDVARIELGDDVQEVLIIDIARQDTY